jgi:signal transduction histidine kinase
MPRPARRCRPYRFFLPADLIESVLDMYSYRLNSRKVRVVKGLRATPSVYGFAGEFRQVLSNLIVNALDAIETEGGLLILRTRPSRLHDREGVRITIADNGSGITPDRMKKIFEAFYTTKKDVGTGLGLSLSQEIVQKHEGSIRAKSRTALPCGTAFSIFWPCKPLLFSQSMHRIPSASSTGTLTLPVAERSVDRI